MTHYTMKLYITGESEVSQRAVSSLRRIMESQSMDCSLTIIDCLIASHLAEEDRVLATPTLLVLEPAPPRRISGDLGNGHRLRRLLDLPAD